MLIDACETDCFISQRNVFLTPVVKARCTDNTDWIPIQSASLTICESGISNNPILSNPSKQTKPRTYSEQVVRDPIMLYRKFAIKAQYLKSPEEYAVLGDLFFPLYAPVYSVGLLRDTAPLFKASALANGPVFRTAITNKIKIYAMAIL